MSLEAVWDLRSRILGAGKDSSSTGAGDASSTSAAQQLLPYSPRSVCVFSAPSPPAPESGSGSTSNSTNPFEDAPSPRGAASISSGSRPIPRAIVFGSEEGSLHYRSYASPEEYGSSESSGSKRNTASHTASFGGRTKSPSRPDRNPNAPRPALGVTPSGRPPVNLPRSYLPVDLPAKSLPGSVVDVIPAVIQNSHATHSINSSHHSGRRNAYNSRQRPPQQPPSFPLVGLFLVLVDDNKGSNKQGGAFVAALVTLQNGAFTKVNTTTTNNVASAIHPRFQLPSRVSCATYHKKCGYVVCGGKRITTIPAWPYIEAAAAVSSSGKQQRQQHASQSNRHSTTTVDFSGTVLPPPGARGGPSSLIVTANGHLAVVAVGNAVYAVPGIEVETTSSGPASPTSASSTASAPECAKVFCFGQSSQIHPVILVDVQDRSVSENWSSLLVCNGREAALVDVHLDSINHFASASPPRNNGSTATTTTASPILSAAASWPFCLLLTSDGLVSVRAASCLAISLKTVEVGTRPNDFFCLESFWGSGSNAGGGRYYFHQSQNASMDPYSRNSISNTANPNFDDLDEGDSNHHPYTSFPWVLSLSYSGQAKLLRCQADTMQDLADRLMRISIDAFGANNFPRSQLAEALHASFTATSYAGPEPTAQSRLLLKQYLESILGLAEFESGAAPGWPTIDVASNRRDGNNKNSMFGGGYSPFRQQNRNQQYENELSESPFANEDAGAGSSTGKQKTEFSPSVTASTPNALLTSTAILCLVCMQLSPSPKGSLANRAARECASQMGVVLLDDGNNRGISNAAIQVNEMVADRLLKEAASNRSLLSGSSSATSGSSGMQRNSGYANANAQASLQMDFVEAATWLLRSCGKHERAIEVLRERLQQHRAPESAKQPVGFWSQIKYESYTAGHLSELWGTESETARLLVLRSPATIRLLESNPQLGLSVFTVNHPQNATQWRQTADQDDPLAHPKHPSQVVRLLKSIKPSVAYPNYRTKLSSKDNSAYADAQDEIEIENDEGSGILPLESGRALAVSFLESSVGISTHRPEENEFDLLGKSMEYAQDVVSDFHDELCFLLLEGVISERGDNSQQQDNPQSDSLSSNSSDGDVTSLGRIYRQKLRRFLRWPQAKIRSERLLEALPRSFFQEQALVLGRLGRHEEALKILYCNCKSMTLALEYCDMLHGRRKTQIEKQRARLAADSMLDDRANDELDEKFQKENAYLPLVRVALESDPDKKRGIASAIQILAMRRGDIERSAALRLLPNNLPVSAVARPFLIPALVDSESQVRRLKVVSSLLRAKHTALKQQLTDAQLKSQANLYVVPQFRAMNIGEPLHSTKPFKARLSSSASPTFPDVVIVKHFFPRHLIIQAKITNNSLAIDGRALGNLAFVVAESSEDAIQPASIAAQVPIKVLPFHTTGSAWCVLTASPSRMEGTAILTCELRYTVLGVDATSGTPLSFGQGATTGRTYVEELQDIEVFASHFS
ncbi:unnamed protein product [Pseudo-nitzschia multistriata]|uniref:Coatomer gamma subunit appendage Ig-like subdomain domain-containing protein n=1 Tax=Pseudo-nitzschia multistriata TaxID=183589 RepID=A0A448YVP0_9STRA|nr:unnamed protein product [Pseudo-nitzschia multistriata]